MEAKIYNIQGKETGTFMLPENIFGLTWNADLVHQVVVSMQSNARQPIAHTKDRGEVRGGGKKPWQQKGTGRARHGSSRSPIWKGGGITHGPRNEKLYARKINQKIKQKALLVALSRKVKDGEVVFVDRLEMQEPKTKQASAFMAAFAKNFSGFNKKKNAALVVLPSAHKPTVKSFRNLGNVAVTEVRNLNPISVLGSKYIVLADPKTAVEVLSKKHVVKAK
ncbi:MAG: 50S ribosomal protein L4 [Patescibacteria group bacterium]